MRQPFCPIDIIYKPVKKRDDSMNYFFSEKLNIANRASFNESAKMKHCLAWQCYFRSNYYARKDKIDHHFENCTGPPGYIYNSNTQSLAFEKNRIYKADIPLAEYINFETTAPTNDCLDPESRKIFAVSYAIISAFHPNLDIDRVIIEHSFGYSRK